MKPYEAISLLLTTIVILVALFRESAVLFFRRPQLVVEAQTESPGIERIVDKDHDRIFYQVRLWVRNKGRGPANRVRVFVGQLTIKDLNGSFNPKSGFLPMHLTWTHSSEHIADSIPPGMGQHCDLGQVVRGPVFVNGCPFPNDVFFVIATQVQPLTKSNGLASGTYRLKLSVGADNAKMPTDVELEVFISGEWSDTKSLMLPKEFWVRVV